VRNIATDAKIEIIRVLNDASAGDVVTLTSALESIQNRLRHGTVQPPVVINLSLVATPPDEILEQQYGQTPDRIIHLRDGLRTPIESLANNFGVVFVASAGNDSDPRDVGMATGMSMTGMRMQARYPAYFAYDNPSGSGIPQVIPVGAVRGDESPASYSNYPGPVGIATYGGEVPTPLPAKPDPQVETTIDPNVPIDMLRGVYSSQLYPELSKDDKQHTPPPPPDLPQEPLPPPYPEELAPDKHAWAYWAGTSFASPIISAVAVLFLEGQQPQAIDVRQQILNAAVQQTTWDRLEPNNGTANGPLIMAVQCQPELP